MPTIPNKLHFIWVGKSIPENYAENVVKWAYGNMFYKVFLWTEDIHVESSIMSFREAFFKLHPEHSHVAMNVSTVDLNVQITFHKEDFTYLRMFIGRIENLIPLSDPALLMEELTVWKNYGAASDIMRAWVIHQEGGIYMDTDTYSNGLPLPCNIQAPLGYLEHTRMFGGKLISINCIMACTVGNAIAKTVASTYEASYRDEYSSPQEGVREITPAAATRHSLVQFSQKTLEMLDDTSDPRYRMAQDIYCENFVMKTTRRNKGGLGDMVQDTTLISFELHSGYYAIVSSEGSWRPESVLPPPTIPVQATASASQQTASSISDSQHEQRRQQGTESMSLLTQTNLTHNE
ncbi:MAG: hypothetical protein MI749_21645 [Desulfovibrionales bacterium]|nr:hypothetical protein [Desulfovibrionales bacterium]